MTYGFQILGPVHLFRNNKSSQIYGGCPENSGQPLFYYLILQTFIGNLRPLQNIENVVILNEVKNLKLLINNNIIDPSLRSRMTKKEFCKGIISLNKLPSDKQKDNPDFTIYNPAPS